MAESSVNAENDVPVRSNSPKPDIWLVNDDPAQLLVQKRLLGRFAASVREFGSPLEAMAASRSEESSPYLVTDFNMPVMKGPQLAAYWCTLHKDARVLILSASEIPTEERKLMDSLAGKPVKLLSSYRIAELTEAASRWFAGHETDEEAVDEGAESTRLEPSVLGKLEQLGGHAFVAKVLGRFVSEVPERMKKIEASCRKRELETLHRAAHSLKGSCGLIGAEKLARVAGSLESAAASEDVEQTRLDALMQQLNDEYELTMREVRARHPR